jgi:hypothetical protein
MTTDDDTPAPKQPRAKASQTGAERQRRHRQNKKLHFFEVTEGTYALLKAIRQQKTWTIEKTVKQALILLEAELNAAAPAITLAEIHKAAAEDKERHEASEPVRARVKTRKPNTPLMPKEIDGQGSLL